MTKFPKLGSVNQWRDMMTAQVLWIYDEI